MAVELAAATAMVILTVAMHGLGLDRLSRILRLESQEEAQAHVSPGSMRGIGFTLGVVLALIALHGAEIWSYAFAFLISGALDDLHTAVFFSTITYAGIGYDDYGLAREWRLFAAIEGVNGIILLGWSTAFFVTVVSRLGRARRA